MQLGNLEIQFIDKLTVRDFQSINRLNNKLSSGEIDEITLSNELFKIVISSINGETDKEKIINQILDIENIEDYSKLNEEIAKRINSLVDPLKKKK